MKRGSAGDLDAPGSGIYHSADGEPPPMERSAHRFAALVLAAAALAGCRGLSREFNQSLPEFIRADPGAEEMEIFAKIRQTRDWTEEDLNRQKELFDAALGAYEEGRYDEAADLIEEFLEQYPGSVYDERARFVMGDAHFRDDEWGHAFTVSKDFAALYPVSIYGPQVMETEYAMGKDYIEGRRATFFGIFTQRGTGEKIMNHIVEAFPSGARAPDAQWALGRYYMEDDDWVKARTAFQYLADHYRTSEWYAPSLYYAAYCAYRRVKGTVYDPRVVAESKIAFETYLREAPDGPWRADAEAIASELEETQAAHLYEVGDWYVGQGKEYTARYYFLKVVTLHPRTGAAVPAQKGLDRLGSGEPSPTPPPEPDSGAPPAAEPPPAEKKGV